MDRTDRQTDRPTSGQILPLLHRTGASTDLKSLRRRRGDAETSQSRVPGRDSEDLRRR
ncbi:hypothetical protein JOB18_045818 [Solea senegalensis]|uniref:Uncharacterized protein n=1 Tax=Solea senegalensis TaxID=28829 RepID=A0AAV6R1N4_SOLSE|nr:hypothetical protein JOB18_045818 [Solea senegalensis]